MKREIYLDNAIKLYREGQKYIYPQNAAKWKECVQSKCMGSLKGKELEISLKIMKCLDENGDLWSVLKECKMNYKIFPDCFGSVLNIVTRFSKKGVEFYSWSMGHIYAKSTTFNEERYLTRLVRQNMQYKRELKRGESILIDEIV